jgi:hypothetical protein
MPKDHGHWCTEIAEKVFCASITHHRKHVLYTVAPRRLKVKIHQGLWLWRTSPPKMEPFDISQWQEMKQTPIYARVGSKTQDNSPTNFNTADSLVVVALRQIEYM